jgi:hypothetical protein
MEELKLEIEELEERIAPGNLTLPGETEGFLTAPSGNITSVCLAASSANRSGQVTVGP